MSKREIKRLSLTYRREIEWLKWYFLQDKNNPHKTMLEQKIYRSFWARKKDEALYYINLQIVTAEYIQKTDTRLLKVIKEAYIYENTDAISACEKILHLKTRLACTCLEQFFDDYFYATYKYLPIEFAKCRQM